jgi:hypothetical protein
MFQYLVDIYTLEGLALKSKKQLMAKTQDYGQLPIAIMCKFYRFLKMKSTTTSNGNKART